MVAKLIAKRPDRCPFVEEGCLRTTGPSSNHDSEYSGRDEGESMAVIQSKNQSLGEEMGLSL